MRMITTLLVVALAVAAPSGAEALIQRFWDYHVAETSGVLAFPEGSEEEYRLFYPEGYGTFPLVVMLHGDGTPGVVTDPRSPYVGGPEKNGEQYDLVARNISAKGFVVIISDRRRLTLDPTVVPPPIFDAQNGFGPLPVGGNLLFLSGFLPPTGVGSLSSPSQIEHCVRTVEALNADDASPIHGKVDTSKINLWGHSGGGRSILTAINQNNFNCWYPACGPLEGIDESQLEISVTGLDDGDPTTGKVSITKFPPLVTYHLPTDIMDRIKSVVTYGALYFNTVFPLGAFVAPALDPLLESTFGAIGSLTTDQTSVLPVPVLNTSKTPVLVTYGTGDNVIPRATTNPVLGLNFFDFATNTGFPALAFRDLYERLNGPRGLLEMEGLIHGAPESQQDALNIDEPQEISLGVGHKFIAATAVRYFTAYTRFFNFFVVRGLCLKLTIPCDALESFSSFEECVQENLLEFEDASKC